MKTVSLVLNTLFFFLICSTSQAQRATSHVPTDEEVFEEAQQDTMNLLNDPKLREQALKESEAASRAGDRVKELSSGDAKTEDEYYRLASDIVKSFKDEKSMRDSVSGGQKDPEGFYKSLTPEQKAKIQELSRKLNPGAAPSNP